MNENEKADISRRNAALSTGPRTPEGKTASSMNALKHGLTAETLVLPSENPENFLAFAEDLLAALVPVGALEEILAERVIMNAWRLRRALRAEVEVYAWPMEMTENTRKPERPKNQDTPDPESVIAAMEARLHKEVDLHNEGPDPESVIALMEARLREEEEGGGKIASPVKNEPLRALEEKKNPPLGAAFAREGAGADALGKLAKYETMLERGLIAALRELQRLQAARGVGGNLPPVLEVSAGLGFTS
jgi:hypothetical protein